MTRAWAESLPLSQTWHWAGITNQRALRALAVGCGLIKRSDSPWSPQFCVLVCDQLVTTLVTGEPTTSFTRTQHDHVSNGENTTHILPPEGGAMRSRDSVKGRLPCCWTRCMPQSAPKHAIGTQRGTHGPTKARAQSQSSYRRYGSVLSTSLGCFLSLAKGFAPWRPVAD